MFVALRPTQHCFCPKSGCSSIALCICFGTCSHANCDGNSEVIHHESVIDEVLHSEDDKRKRFLPHTRGFVHFCHVSRGKIVGLRPLKIAHMPIASSIPTGQLIPETPIRSCKLKYFKTPTTATAEQVRSFHRYPLACAY